MPQFGHCPVNSALGGMNGCCTAQGSLANAGIASTVINARPPRVIKLNSRREYSRMRTSSQEPAFSATGKHFRKFVPVKRMPAFSCLKDKTAHRAETRVSRQGCTFRLHPVHTMRRDMDQRFVRSIQSNPFYVGLLLQGKGYPGGSGWQGMASGGLQ
jgi:hypothetical protein